MEKSPPEKESLTARGRRLLKTFLKKKLPRNFPDPATFESVSLAARNYRCDLQHYMDIDPAAANHSPDFVRNFGGFHPPGEQRPLNRIDAGDRVRADMLLLLLREITVRRVPGAMAELGVYRGTSARLIHHYCPERKLYLFDTFTGLPTRIWPRSPSTSPTTSSSSLPTPVLTSCSRPSRR